MVFVRKPHGVDFKYLYVFELTKGGGVHLHGFFSGFFDLYVNEYGYLSSLFFDKLGFQSFIPASDVNEFYLLKYITKTESRISSRRFYRSRNLNKPIITTFKDNFNDFMTLNWSNRNEYCNIVTIPY